MRLAMIAGLESELRMRDGPRPGCLERLGAEGADLRIGGELLTDVVAVAGEMTPPDGRAVEDPAVRAGQREIGGVAPGQPAHFFAGVDVVRGDRMLVADVVRWRQRH